jgi:hypothetical protein
MVAALHDRVSGFYLDPALRVIANNDVFAAGLLCCAAIDFIALCADDEPETWLTRTLVPLTSAHSANQFWRRFRHGLVHEGRIKGLDLRCVSAGYSHPTRRRWQGPFSIFRRK